jgi:DnaJ-class molecular chaperone
MNNHDLYGSISVTPWEAKNGASKIVNIPWGFQKRLYRVAVPPGIQNGNTLRLKSLGKIRPDGLRGDLFLLVNIEKT